MNTGQKPEHDITDLRADTVEREPLLFVLGALLTLEAVFMLGVTVWLAFELFTTTGETFVSAVAIATLAALGTIWLVATAVGTFRGQAWIRASSVTWHILMIVAAIAWFQGILVGPDLGWVLLVLAIVAIGITVSRPITRSTRRPEPSEDEDGSGKAF